MKTTTYAGINYAGHTNANRDAQTLIRYGVIPHHAVGSAWYESSEEHYGKPTCGHCGNTAHEPRNNFDYTAECGVFVCKDCGNAHYPMELTEGQSCPDCNGETVETEFEIARHESEDYACHHCGKIFGSESAFPESPISHYIDYDEISAEQGGDDSDIFVSKSKFFTYAQFCSPCAPGACYLLNPLETPNDDNRAYCFGHDWFEDGVAPYPVYSVETGELVSN